MTTWTSKPWDSQNLPRVGCLPGREKSNLVLERALARAIRGLPPEPRTFIWKDWSGDPWYPLAMSTYPSMPIPMYPLIRAGVRRALGSQ